MVGTVYILRIHFRSIVLPFPLKTELRVSEFLRQFVHLVVDSFVDNASVDLSCTDFGMSEHLADGFDGPLA